MKGTATFLTAILLGLTAACGSNDPTPGAGSSAGPTSASTTASQPAGSTEAVAVTFMSSGGLKPVSTQRVYAVDAAPPPGTSRAELDRILAAASNPRLRDLELVPVPRNTCCDLRAYTVAITYADGSSTSFRTLDGLQQPPAFEHLLSMLG